MITQCRDTPWRVSTRKFQKLPKKSISSIINHFKGAVKRYANKNDIFFYWQPNYYEHIIQKDQELLNIRNYITNNPLNWENDRNNI